MNIRKFFKIETYDNFVTEKVDVIQNKLLGDYNAKGKYVINKKIVNELVELVKVKKESYNNSIFATAKTKAGKLIDFQIDFKKNSNSNLAAGVLSTLEPVEKQGGRLTNIIKTPIAKYSNTLTPDFIDRTLETFNVIIADEAIKNKSDEGQDAYLIKRNMLLKALDNLTADNYNVIYEDYFTQRINLLKQTNNAYSKKILAIFNEEFNKMSEYFLVDKKSKKITNYKAMNELLDKAFEDLSGLENYKEQEKQYRERILPILGMFISSAERVEKTAQSQVLDTFPKKTKEALTDTLVDIKQAQQQTASQEVQERNPEVIQTNMNKKINNISEKVGGPVVQERVVEKEVIKEVPVQQDRTPTQEQSAGLSQTNTGSYPRVQSIIDGLNAAAAAGNHDLGHGKGDTPPQNRTSDSDTQTSPQGDMTDDAGEKTLLDMNDEKPILPRENLVEELQRKSEQHKQEQEILLKEQDLSVSAQFPDNIRQQPSAQPSPNGQNTSITSQNSLLQPETPTRKTRERSLFG